MPCVTDREASIVDPGDFMQPVHNGQKPAPQAKMGGSDQPMCPSQRASPYLMPATRTWVTCFWRASALTAPPLGTFQHGRISQCSEGAILAQ